MASTSTVPRDSPEQTGAVLALTDIQVRFGGVTALESVSLEVRPGHVLGVIGPNGAGKTTLFNVVCGFIRPDAGTLRWHGAPFRPRPHRLAGMGIARTLQGVGLFAGLTMLENVMVGAAAAPAAGRPRARSGRAGLTSVLLGLPRADRAERQLRERAMGYLDQFGLARYAAALPGAVPYPLQKRVALARALVSEPKLLLLDEPAGGLGADDIAELAELIRSLPTGASGNGSCAVMLVEHHMDLVMQVCDQIVVLDFGRVVASGPPAVVQADPAVAAAYLGADPTEVDA